MSRPTGRRGLAARWRSRQLPGATTSGTVLARAEEVTVRLGRALILDSVTLEVRAGEVLALVGPNGAGKSTLFAALAGDVEPEAGRVQLDGRPLAMWSGPEAAMRRAVLLQQVTLSFPFTVREVVEMGRAPWHGSQREDDDDAAVADAMHQADVDQFAARRFGSLSGGEKARVALARVLAQQADLLLLDEPTAALDLRHQELVLQVARERARAGAGIAMVLHDLNLAAAHADRVAVLSHGRVVACGAPADVLTEDVLAEVYQQPVDVMAHPRGPGVVILPRRGAAPAR